MSKKKRDPIGRRQETGRRLFWGSVLVAATLCVLGLAHTWTRVAVLDRSYQLGRAHTEGERLTRELEKLKLEVATLEATARVDREAKTSLEMQRPPPERIVVVPAAVVTAAKGGGPGALASNDQ